MGTSLILQPCRYTERIPVIMMDNRRQFRLMRTTIHQKTRANCLGESMKQIIEVTDLRLNHNSGKLVALMDIEVQGARIVGCPVFTGRNGNIFFTGPTISTVQDGVKDYEDVVKFSGLAVSKLRKAASKGYKETMASGAFTPVTLSVEKNALRSCLVISSIDPTHQYRQLAGFCRITVDDMQFKKCRVMRDPKSGELGIIGPGYTVKDSDGKYVDHPMVVFSDHLEALLAETAVRNDFITRFQPTSSIVIV
jgi:hypothetical protein